MTSSTSLSFIHELGRVCCLRFALMLDFSVEVNGNTRSKHVCLHCHGQFAARLSPQDRSTKRFAGAWHNSCVQVYRGPEERCKCKKTLLGDSAVKAAAASGEFGALPSQFRDKASLQSRNSVPEARSPHVAATGHNVRRDQCEIFV